MKNKKLVISICAFVFILLLGFSLDKKTSEAPTATVGDVIAQDYKNATYNIDGVDVTLANGYAEVEAASGSASKIVTRYFGNELVTDLDGDGDEDVAFILTQETDGSGTFFYAVAALNTDAGYIGSDGYLLGDRIAPQSTNLSQNPIQKYVVVFNYADRMLGESMTTQPSVGKSVYLKIDPENIQWAIVEPNFEGESNLSAEIQINEPAFGGVISSPLQLSGEAIGPWFFEASLPVEVRDWEGNVIAQSYVTAEGDWMTVDLVPFTGEVTFTSPYTAGDAEEEKQGSIVFKKDNPSGLPEHDGEIVVPIFFAD